MVLNNTGRKSRKYLRQGASAIAAAALLTALALVGVTSATAADGIPPLDVNVTDSNVTITGTVSGDAATGVGTFDLTVVNNDVVDGQTVGHSVSFYLGSDLFVKGTEAILDATPTPLSGTFALWEGDTQVSIKLATGPGLTQVWSGTLVRPVAPPEPSATIGTPNLTMQFEPDAVDGYITAAGSVEFQNLGECTDTTVSFTVEGPGSPSAEDSSTEGGSYQSAFPVTLTTEAQTFTVTAHAVACGMVLASSAPSTLTLPILDPEEPGGGGENPGGGDNSGGENPDNGGPSGGDNSGGTPNTGTPQESGTPNPSGSPTPVISNGDLPGSVNGGLISPMVWAGLPIQAKVALGVVAALVLYLGAHTGIVLWKRRKPSKLAVVTGDVE